MKKKFFISSIFSLLALTLSAQDTVHVKYIPSGELLENAIKQHDEENYSEAVKIFKYVYPGDTNYAIAQYELANTLLAMEKYDECIEICQEGLKTVNHLTPNFYNLLGTSLDESNKPEEAILTYSKGIEIFPTNYLLYFNRAVTYKKMEKHQDCIDDLKRTIQHNPFHANSHLTLAEYAKEQGEIAKALMGYNIYLMMSGKSNTEILGQINEYVNESYDNKSIDVQTSQESFEDIDEMLASLATKSKKYKTPNKLSLPFVKQNHLLLTELSKRELETGFYDTYYIKFYQQLMIDDKFNDLMYYNLRSATNKSVVSVLEKNIKSIQSFPDYAGKTWQRSCSDRFENFDGKDQTIHYFWSGSSAIEGRGAIIDNEPVGLFEYYYSFGKMSAYGRYDEDGERNGVWTYLHKNGNRSGKETYEAGDLVGMDTSLHDNGVLKSVTPYVDGKPNGEETNYNNTGLVSNTLTYKDGVVTGPAKYYFDFGAMQYAFSYKNEEIHGDFVQYYDNGQIKEKVVFENGSRQGTSIKYHKNGQKSSEGTYTAGSLNGKYTTWHENGELKSEAEYLDGTAINIRKQYYSNGKLEIEENFDETGKKTGIYKEYDEQGNLNLQLEYKKGDLIAYKVFHKDGSLIKEAKKKGGNFLFENFYSDGTIRATGSYVPGDKGKDGEWKFYNYNGVLSSITQHENGQQIGEAIEYFTTGQLYSKTPYKNGAKNGLYTQYYSNGQVSYEGHYVNNKKEGRWTSYRINGSISKETYYVKGKINGPMTYYAVNGRLDFVDNYDMDQNLGFEIFDTNGVSIQKVVISGDSSTYSPQFPTGEKIRTFTKKGNIYHGPSTSYYVDGKKSSDGQYWNGNKHGQWTNYHDNGQVSSKGSYLYGYKNGNWTYYYESGKKSREETFINGDLDGSKIYYFENGKVDSEFKYVNGKRQGASIFNDPNGITQHIRYYENGKIVSYSYLGKDGKEIEAIPIENETCDCKSFFSNGKESRVFSMVNDNFNGDYLEYYESGQLYSKSTYDNGLRQGVKVLYYENGNKKSEMTYKDDEIEGIASYYNEDGTLKTTKTYIQSILHGEVINFNHGKTTTSELYYDGNKISK